MAREKKKLKGCYMGRQVHIGGGLKGSGPRNPSKKKKKE